MHSIGVIRAATFGFSGNWILDHLSRDTDRISRVRKLIRRVVGNPIELDDPLVADDLDTDLVFMLFGPYRVHPTHETRDRCRHAPLG